MVAIDGNSYEDAAAELQVSVGTIRSRLSRARSQLREVQFRRASVGTPERKPWSPAPAPAFVTAENPPPSVATQPPAPITAPPPRLTPLPLPLSSIGLSAGRHIPRNLDDLVSLRNLIGSDRYREGPSRSLQPQYSSVGWLPQKLLCNAGTLAIRDPSQAKARGPPG